MTGQIQRIKAIVEEIDRFGVYIRVRTTRHGPVRKTSFFLFWRSELRVAEDVEIVIILTKRDDTWIPEAFWPDDIAPLEELP